MALQFTYTKPPKGAVVLTREEALKYQWKQITDQPKTEMWPFSWGIAGLGTLAAASAMSINQRFRRTLKLRHFGYISSAIPLVIAPVIFTGVFHVQLVTEDIIMAQPNCPLCLQYKAAAVQLAFGFAWPVMLSPLANFTFALRYGTYPIPHWKDFKGTYNLWAKIMGGMGKTPIILACIQIVAAGYMAYVETEYLHKLNCKLQGKWEERETVELNKVSE